MLHTCQSNRLELLTDRLADLLRSPPRAPLAREVVVVQSNGMARWLALRLADRLGVCANLSFQFPASFLWEMSRAVLRQLPPTSSFDKPVLAWRLVELLGNLEDATCFAAPRAWLGDDRDDFRRYELACHVADCFDQYLVYRPDWIVKWERGEEDHWQAELWRRLARTGEAHRVRVQEQFRAALQHGDVDRRRLPERVAMVGVAALPPLYLDLLAELARYLDVHLFLLDPCREYWGDIRAERDLARLGEEIDPDEAYLTVGNPLLASLGKQGRDFLDLLLAYPRVEWEGFVEPGGDDLLHVLQADILHLRERGSDCPPLPLRPDDRSVQIHVCHGPMREVEVLHDQLLALFETHRDLRPSDVIVMAPDIARYGPLIEAVFDTAPRERRIPFSIADQGLQAENPLVEAFFELLDLGGARFDATQVLGLLELPAVRRRFELAEDDLERIRRWVRQSGIRWGIDADIKRGWDLPATPEHTWRMGLDRLLLGYALPGEGRELYAGILPCDEVEGGEAQALGQWYSFTEALFGLDARLRERRSPAEWVAALGAVLDRFFEPREREENELQLIRAALETLRDNTELARFDEPVALSVVKSALRRQVNQVESGAGRFLGGGVTCCAMVPMRSIPFPVICLIGMNDDAYPRPHRPVDFDLMATRFRRGDRSRRQDDRYLFLETLLSARRCLYLSYVGQNIRDNSVLPPSVLVGELLDVVDRGFQRAGGGRASEQLVTRHPLQAFSRRYFNGSDPRLFSYAGEWVDASRQAGRGERDPAPLLAGELPEPEPALRMVTLEGLIGFFRHPARWLLRERLGIRPDEGEEALATREPFVLDGLENYQLLDQTLELHLEGRPVAEIETVLRAGGALPHGQVGECVFAAAGERVARFAGRLGRALPRRGVEPLVVDLSLGEFRLTGQLAGLTRTGWVGYRLARMKAGDYLNLWLHHLALNAAAPDGVALNSHWVAEDQDVVLEPVEHPQAQLQALLELYWQGTRRLLHFFPRSALAYIQQLRQDKQPDPDKALRTARNVWEGSDFGKGHPERDDPFYQLAFRDTDPLDAEFTALAGAVFEPLFARVQPERGD